MNVTEFYRPAAAASSSNKFCWKPITSQKYYIVFASLRDGVLRADSEEVTDAYVEWSEENEAKVERGLGTRKTYSIILPSILRPLPLIYYYTLSIACLASIT